MTAAPAVSPPRHVYLVDGSGYIFRAYHALPPLTRADGTPVNAVLGFTNMLMKLIAETDADHIAVIFDAGRESFRNQIYPAYKAHRPDAPAELVPQFALIREATRAFNVSCIELAGYEADDLIATYARQAAAGGARVTVVSSDKDLMQLVGDGIIMLDPIKNRPIGPDQVREKFGVGPEKVIDVQALAGDATDNVPGVPGIGVKTAADLITNYGDLDTLLARAGEIKQPKRRETLLQNAEQARISRELVRLRDDVPVEEALETFIRREPDSETLLAFLRENQFRALVTRVENRLAAAGRIADGETAATKQGAEPALAEPTPPAAVLSVVSTSYELVQDLAALDDWVARATAAGVVAVDTETNGLDALRCELVGVSLSVEPGRACYIPIGHKTNGGNGQGTLDFGRDDAKGKGEGVPSLVAGQLPRDEVLGRLKPLLENPGILKVGQNIKFDMIVLGRAGLAVAPIDDTMQISYALEAGAHGHGMDELATIYLDHQTIKFTEVAGTGRAKVTFDYVPLDKARDYAAEDADITLRLHRLLKPRLVQERMLTLYETIERPLIPVVAEMEQAGIKVDQQVLRRLSAEFAERLTELETEIHKLAGRPFNVGSPKQLGEVLFDEMGLSGGKKGKTGAYATGADRLEELAAQGHDLPARVLDWRQLSKLKSTYADALVAQTNPETGRVHTSLSLAVASTGRLSSTDPNLQNIPIRTEEGRKIRRAFIAEAGDKLLSVDYSQIELRLAAHMAEIPALKEAFRNGADIHAITASQIFGVPVDGMDPMIRRRAKAINFGIIYGISPFGLAQQLGIPQGEAKAYIEAYFARYPGIRDYMERTKKLARETGYVTTLFGRRCYLPGINDKNPARRSFMERAAINAPLQGTAADIIKRAMIRVPPALASAGLKARMLLQVHDELLFEVPDAEVERTAALVRRVMEQATLPVLELSVPLVAEAGIGDNWAEAH
ncbi:DNA polymerase I [Rhodospirillaceae bacterium SYSU D60014]|uniref:DNA polymerase I n=1 Tax=Virgifigura deserti TaxID=2268457 RepID=UPI000E66CB5B